MIVLNPPVIDVLHGDLLLFAGDSSKSSSDRYSNSYTVNHPVNHSEYVEFVWGL